MAKQNAWIVGDGYSDATEVVWFDAGMSAQEVRESLIDHDGYAEDTTVTLREDEADVIARISLSPLESIGGEDAHLEMAYEDLFAFND